jgi:RluA family pseudouridine synthase
MDPTPKVQVLEQDPDVLVILKPAGLLSLPDGYDPRQPYLQGVLEADYGRLWMVHRLDRETSGVMALARNPAAHQALSIQFERRQAVKIYSGLVHGNPEWDEYESTVPLRMGVGRRKRTVVDEARGKPAHTIFRVRKRFSEYTLLECQPLTGRTHQIRAHLYALGFPLVNDPLYGAYAPRSLGHLQRLGLHAYSLTFTHPSRREVVCYSAPYPDDFASAISALMTRTT